METHFVVAGYIFHDNKVLLIHHKKLDLWLPVGGHIQENETPDDALLREIREEVGIDVEIMSKSELRMDGNVKKNLALPFHANVHSVGDHDHCCFFYICKAVNPEMLKANHEIKGAEWLSKNELEKPHIPADVRTMALKGFEILTNFK